MNGLPGSPATPTSADRRAFSATRLSGFFARFIRPALAGLAVALLGSFAVSSLQAQTAYYSGQLTTINNFSVSGYLPAPQGVAEDSSGDLFIADAGNGTLANPPGVYEMTVTASGTYNTPVQIAASTTFYDPVSVTVDPTGNVWVADEGNGTPGTGGFYIIVYTSGTGYAATAIAITAPTPYTWQNPVGIVSDPAGNVYGTDFNNNEVFILSGTPAAVAAVNTPDGLTSDVSGDIFVTDRADATVEVLIGGSGPAQAYTLIQSNLSTSEGTDPLLGLTVDSGENLWATFFTNTDGKPTLQEFVYNGSINSPSTNYPTAQTWAPGNSFKNPNGVHWDGRNNILIADSGNGIIYKMPFDRINFGSSAVGTTSTSSPISIPFTITGSGTILAPTVLTTGAASLDFTDAGGGSCAAGSVTAGTSCTVNVQFKPTLTGLRSGSVELLSSTGVIASIYLSGTGTGPQPTFIPGTTSAVGSGFTTPHGVAVDASGDVFIVDNSSGKVSEVKGGVTTTLATSTGANGVAVDGAGNVFFTDSTGVEEIPFNGTSYGAVTSVASTAVFTSPSGIAIGPNGDIYVADPGANTVDVIHPGGSPMEGYSVATINAAFTFNAPQDVAVDANGNVYVADTGDNLIKEISAVNGNIAFNSTLSTLFSGHTFSAPDGIAVDANGSIYVADSGNKAVVEFPFTGSTFGSAVTLAGSLSSSPFSVRVGGSGNVYYSAGAAVTELNLATPPTLNFLAAQLNTNSSDSPKTVTVANFGNTSLNFTGLAFPTDFTNDASSTCTSSTSLAQQITCNIGIDFKPLTASAHSEHVTLTDNSLNGSGVQQQITVNGTGVNITITPSSTTLPGGTVGTVYDGTGLQFAATGGTGPYTWSESGSTLPAGLTLSSGGLLSGTPTTAGTTSGITINVTDTGSSVQTSKTYSLTISPGTTTTTEANETAPYSTSTQNVTLTATVTPSIVNEGTVTFTIAPFGSASTPVTVASGSASTSYPIPAGQAAGTYTITASYTDAAGNWTSSSDNTHTLTIGKANQAALTLNATSPATYNTQQTLSTTGGSGTGAVTYDVGSSTACSVSGATLTITSGTGTCSVTATKAADTNYNAATSNTVTITVQPATQAALTLTATSPAAYNSQQTLSASGGSGTGAVTYSVGASTACSVTGSTLTITAGTGTCSVTATKAADANYTAATSNTVTITVQPANQAALTLTATSPATYNTQQTLAATGGSGTGAVTYSVGASTACSVTGATLTITSGTGTCSVTATKAADANYNAATSNTVTITVQTATQAALTLTATSPATYNTQQTLAATGGSGTGAVTYSVGASTACSVTGSTLTITSGTGTCSVTATKAADANYSVATSNTVTITVQPATQAALTLTATSPATYNTQQTLAATGGSGTGAISYSVGSSTACSVTGSTLSITAGTGTCSVTATKAADANYSAATSNTVTITVQPAAQAALTLNATSPAAYNSTQTLTTTGGSGTGAVTYSVGSSTACSVTGSTLTITAGSGTCSVTATKAADANYNAATSNTVTITVTTAAQATLTVNVTSPASYGSQQTLSITGGSGTGAVTYSIGSSTACTLSGTTLTITAGSGTCAVTATKAADANYNQATSAAATVTIQKAVLTVTANNASRAYGAANPTFSGVIAGYVNGDTSAVVSGSPSFSTTATATSAVGTYPITPAIGTLAATNYSFAFVNGTLTITQATPTITWAAPAAITYGTALSGTQLDASSTVAGTFVYTPPAGTVLNAGANQTLSVTLNPTDTTDYTSATTSVTITVNPAAPTITFTVPNHTFGDAPFTVAATSNSTGAITYSVVSGSATISGSTVTLTGGGTVVLMASQAAAGNYAAGTQTATFTVAPATTNTLGFASIPSQTYGNAPFTVSASSTSNGAVTYSIISGPATINATSGLVTLTGAGTLTIGASQAATLSYGASTAQTVISVAKQASVTTVAADSTSINPNQSVTLTATVAPAVLGTPTGTVTFFSGTSQLGTPVAVAGGTAKLTVPTLPPGSNPISATYSGDGNFLVSSGTLSGGVTVAPFTFTMTATPSTQTGLSGTTFTYQLNVTPTYGTYPGTVTFAATGLPTGATATFTPSTIAANGGAQTVSMAVSTTATTASLQTLPASRRFAPVALALLLLPLAGTRRMRRQGRRFSQFFCLLVLALAGVAATTALTGCGSSGFQKTTTTTPQSYTITVTATSGNVTQTSTVTLSLQQ